MGGLARRATFFQQKFTDQPRILVAGAYEFSAKAGELPPPGTLEALAEAFDFMNYDVALLSDEEQRMLNRVGVTPPKAWKTASQEAFRTVKTPNGTVGFLSFPPLPAGTDTPDTALVEEVTRAVAKVKPTVDLLVGLSPWGAYGEKEYLDRRPDAVPHILLGNGRGMSFVKRFSSGDRVLWSRPYPRGKTVTRFSLMSWPAGDDFEWSDEMVSSAAELLNDTVQQNPHVRGIFDKADTK